MTLLDYYMRSVRSQLVTITLHGIIAQLINCTVCPYAAVELSEKWKGTGCRMQYIGSPAAKQQSLAAKRHSARKGRILRLTL